MSFFLFKIHWKPSTISQPMPWLLLWGTQLSLRLLGDLALSGLHGALPRAEASPAHQMPATTQSSQISYLHETQTRSAWLLVLRRMIRFALRLKVRTLQPTSPTAGSADSPAHEPHGLCFISPSPTPLPFPRDEIYLHPQIHYDRGTLSPPESPGKWKPKSGDIIRCL